MEASRAIYWNIGHGWTTLVPMYLLTIAAIALFAYGFWQRLQVYQQGQPINRTDHLGERLAEAITSVLMQRKVIRVRWPGLAHSVFFWGFFFAFYWHHSHCDSG